MTQTRSVLPLLAALLLLLAPACSSSEPDDEVQAKSSTTEILEEPEAEPVVESESFYSLQTHSLEGDPVELEEFRGQVALVVNVASKCGLTPQYTKLEKLYEELEPRGFAILAFPSNDFGAQEPGTPAEIRTFCTERYDVGFPLFEKRHVKGEEKDEVYEYLTRELEEPTWNFTKYLVDREGRVLARFDPRTEPDDAELRAAIEKALEG